MSIRILWEGSFFSNHSLALVNREIVAELAAAPGLELAIHSGEADVDRSWDGDRASRLRALERPLSTAPDVCVRHRWPLDLHPPREGKWVIMQPWEYGAIPRRWYDPMRFQADEVWVYSSFNKACYVEAGIAEEKIRVVPLGVHPAMLGEPQPFPLRTRKRFRFLFVGGTILRKGIDTLLDCYTRTFTAEDDVCLVIKDVGVGSFYRGQTQESLIREIQSNPRMPEIEYLTEDLTSEQLRDLYHACDCLVHPFRGEGFGLPIAEAMACGLPVVVPDQGGASDFCTPETAILVPSRRAFVSGSVGMDTIATPWWLNVDSAALRARMREIYEDPAGAGEIAASGQRLVRERFTWAAAGAVAAGRLRALAGRSPVAVRDDHHEQHRLRVDAGTERWKAGDVSSAIRHFARARERGTDLDVVYNLAALLLEGHDHAAAASMLEEILHAIVDGAPSTETTDLAVDSAALLALCRKLAGDLDAARRALETGLRVSPDHPVLRDRLRDLDTSVGASTESRRSAPGIRWWAPIFGGTGYADESRSFLLGLHGAGDWKIRLDPHDPVKDHGLIPKADYATLESYTKQAIPTVDLDYQHSPPSGFLVPAARLSVARTMFETDRISDEWVDLCNQFTEVWVPTEFNRETFARSGVVREKVRVVPGCIDARKCDPSRYPRISLSKREVFTFLSIFDFTPRKGWDVLLQAYFEEFHASEPVCLVVKVVNTFRETVKPQQRVQEFVRKHGYRRTADYLLITEYYPEDSIRALYGSCDAFVLPSRGEGWGRPYMEAMSFGLPTIGTRWSGNLEFMNDQNSFLIDVDGLEPCEWRWPGMPFYEGHQWAVPSVASTRRWMRHVYENRDEARTRGAKAREDILARYDQTTIADTLKSNFLRLLQQA